MVKGEGLSVRLRPLVQTVSSQSHRLAHFIFSAPLLGQLIASDDFASLEVSDTQDWVLRIFVIEQRGQREAKETKMYPVITWNMQGASNGEDAASKWTTGVTPLAKKVGGVVMLQESGPNPPSSALFYYLLDNGVENALWNLGTSSRYDWRYLYRLQTDPNGGTWTGGRVNLLIVSPPNANVDEVTVVPSPLGGRDALGIRLNNTWYFTLHTWSGGGNDAPSTLMAINNFVNGRNQDENWIAAGDFNRDPASLQVAVNVLGVTIRSTGQPTQQSGGELDYAVTSAGVDLQEDPERWGIMSDHVAVVL